MPLKPNEVVPTLYYEALVTSSYETSGYLNYI